MPSYFNQDDKETGATVGNAYVRWGVKPEHELYFPCTAWCVDDSILKDLNTMPEILYVILRMEDKVTRYRALVSDFTDHGFPVNRGYGKQTGLATEYWVKGT